MIKIYHNPRCSKSREGLEVLKNTGKEFEVVPYLVKPPTPGELKHLITLLGIKPEHLVRKNEPIWKSKYKGKSLTDNQLIQAMTDFPKLIERPIIINGNKAVVGRPSERILEIIS